MEPKRVSSVVPWALGLTLVAVLSVGVHELVQRRERWLESRLAGRPNVSEIVEPFVFVDGSTSKFDGTWIVEFKDGRGVERELSLAEGQSGLGKPFVLRQGQLSRELEIAGEEERLLFRLLERWAEADPEAARNSQAPENALEVEGKAVVIGVLQKLHDRLRVRRP